MADDDINVLGRDDLLGCLDYMCKQRLAGNLMQHLGAFGLETGALARSHDHDGEIRSSVGFLVTHQTIILKPAAQVRETGGRNMPVALAPGSGGQWRAGQNGFP